MKLTAVFSDSAGATFVMLVGLNGRPLGEQQGRHQVQAEQDRQDEAGDVLAAHGETPTEPRSVSASGGGAASSSTSSGPMMRSQPRTNPTHSAKNATIRSSTHTSAMALLGFARAVSMYTGRSMP